MVIYIISLLISLIFCVLSTKTQKKHLKVLCCIASALPFFLVASLRSESVGIDSWHNYKPTFETVANDFNSANYNIMEWLSYKYEPGFSIIVIVLASIFKSFTALFTFCSGFIVFFTFSAIYQQSKKPWLSILIYFLSGGFLLSMNGMRGFMGLSLAIYALKFIPQKNLLKYMLCITAGVLLHKSTIIFLLLYPLSKIKIKISWIVAVLIASIPLSFVIYRIAEILLGNTTYHNYFTATPNHFIDPLYSMLIINIILLLIFVINYKQHKNDEYYDLFLKMQVVSVIVCIFSFNIPLAFRVEHIVDYVHILSIPYNLYLLKKTYGSKRIYSIIASSIIVIYSFYFTHVFVLSDDNQVRDYSSVIRSQND